jgi:hypothetical protein
MNAERQKISNNEPSRPVGSCSSSRAVPGRAGRRVPGIAHVWVAIAAAALGAVLPTCLDERLRRRELARPRQR